MKKMNSLLVKGFQASKCKTQLRLGTSRIKLLRNKKLAQIATDRREVAELLRNKQDNNSRLLVEHVIIEQDLIEAYDLLSLYAERIAAQLSVIDSQKTCPPDLKENISTLLYASSRCAELPDFAQIRPMFVAKYGKEFVSAATELRPGCGVNAMVVEKLSSNGATGETKLRLLKEIAAEHNVDWDPTPFEKEGRVDRDNVIPDTSSFSVDDFPSVPNQKPTLGTHVSQPANTTSSISGRPHNVEPTDSPRPRDDRTDLPGAFPKHGPPSRAPPGRDQLKAENLKVDDGHPDMDLGSREAQSRRIQRRESDSFIASSPQARHELQDSRRNSIGVPREKSLRSRTESARGDVDESLLRDYKKHNQRDSGSEDIEEANDRKSSHGKEYEAGTGSRLSQKFTAKEVFVKGDQFVEEDEFGRTSNRDGSGKGRFQREDPYPEEDELGRVSNRDGSGKGSAQHNPQYTEEDEFRRTSNRDGSRKGRPQHEDQHAEEDELGRASNRNGSRKGRPQHEDAHPEEDKLGRGSSREGSGKGRPLHKPQYTEEDEFGRTSNRDGSRKGRPQHEDAYPEEDKLGRGPSREGSGDKMPHLETSVDEGSRGRISARVKEDKLYGGKKPKHVYSDEETDHRSEEPRQRDSTCKTSKHSDEDPEWVDEHFRNSVTTRMARHSGDEYRASGNERESSNRRISVGDMSRKGSKPSVPQKEVAKYPDKRDTRDVPQYDSSEDEYDSRRSGAKRPESRHKPTDIRNLDRSSEAGEEGYRKDTRTRLSIVDEQRRDVQDDQRARRSVRENPVNDHLNPISITPNDSERRMSLPGGGGYDKSKYQGNRPHADYDESVRRRATLGPEEIRPARARETTDSTKSRFGEREKQVENRRQSAPLSKEDGMAGRQSQSDKTDRQHKVDSPAQYDDDGPSRFSMRDDYEYSPSTRTSRDRSDRQRSVENPARVGDGRPPPRFTKDVSQPNVDDGDLRDKPQRFVNRSELRPRTNLQTAKTDPQLSGTAKSPVPDHRKSASAFFESSSKASTQHLQKPSPEETQSPRQGSSAPSKPAFKKPPDLDSLLQMFAPKK